MINYNSKALEEADHSILSRAVYVDARKDVDTGKLKGHSHLFCSFYQ